VAAPTTFAPMTGQILSPLLQINRGSGHLGDEISAAEGRVRDESAMRKDGQWCHLRHCVTSSPEDRRRLGWWPWSRRETGWADRCNRSAKGPARRTSE